MKVCNTCKIEKPLNNFNKSKKSKDGYSYYCKDCIKESRKKYKERKLEYQKKYYNKNKEEVQKRNQEYREENRERVLAKMREYYLKNAEEIKAYSKSYYHKKKRYVLNPSYTKEERRAEFLKTLEVKGDYNKTSYSNRNILTFQPHFYETEKNMWQNKEVREYIYNNRMKYLNKKPDKLSDREILRAFKISGIHYGFSHFSPFWIKTFIDEFNIKSIYDPCGGWGHRLIGAWDIDYYYNDIDERTCNGVRKIYEEHRSEDTPQKKFYCEDASEFSPNEVYDAVFTCPPYFDLEKYNYENTSTNKYPTYEDWLNNWWNGVVKSCSPTKYFAFVINGMYKDDMVNVVINNGYELIGERNLGKKKSHYGGMTKEFLVILGHI